MWQHLQRDSFLQVNELARDTPMLHEPLTLFAQYGVLLFAGIVVLAWWQARHDPRPAMMAAALWTPLAALLALGLNQPLGRLVHEARPFTVLPHALVLVEHSHDFSFPSDHAVMAGAVTAGVLLGHRRRGWFTAAAAVLRPSPACTSGRTSRSTSSRACSSVPPSRSAATWCSDRSSSAS